MQQQEHSMPEKTHRSGRTVFSPWSSKKWRKCPLGNKRWSFRLRLYAWKNQGNAKREIELCFPCIGTCKKASASSTVFSLFLYFTWHLILAQSRAGRRRCPNKICKETKVILISVLCFAEPNYLIKLCAPLRSL